VALFFDHCLKKCLSLVCSIKYYTKLESSGYNIKLTIQYLSDDLSNRQIDTGAESINGFRLLRNQNLRLSTNTK